MHVKVDHALNLIFAHVQGQSRNLDVYVVEMVQPHPLLLYVVDAPYMWLRWSRLVCPRSLSQRHVGRLAMGSEGLDDSSFISGGCRTRRV